jgi:transcriptional accessory protein Tex/SPT6
LNVKVRDIKAKVYQLDKTRIHPESYDLAYKISYDALEDDENEALGEDNKTEFYIKKF